MAGEKSVVVRMTQKRMSLLSTVTVTSTIPEGLIGPDYCDYLLFDRVTGIISSKLHLIDM